MLQPTRKSIALGASPKVQTMCMTSLYAGAKSIINANHHQSCACDRVKIKSMLNAAIKAKIHLKLSRSDNVKV